MTPTAPSNDRWRQAANQTQKAARILTETAGRIPAAPPVGPDRKKLARAVTEAAQALGTLKRALAGTPKSQP